MKKVVNKTRKVATTESLDKKEKAGISVGLSSGAPPARLELATL